MDKCAYKKMAEYEKSRMRKIMENKPYAENICCSDAKIIRIPRGWQRVMPKMDRMLLEVEEAIHYNEKLTEGVRT
jgi:hypothetical protein